MRIDTTTWFTVLALIKNDAWWSIAQVHLTRTHILHRYARHSIRERERVYDMKCDLTVGRVTVYRSLALVVPVNRTQITDSAMTATPCVQTWSIERTTFPIRPNVGIQMNLTVFWDLSFEIEIKFDFMRKKWNSALLIPSKSDTIEIVCRWNMFWIFFTWISLELKCQHTKWESRQTDNNRIGLDWPVWFDGILKWTNEHETKTKVFQLKNKICWYFCRSWNRNEIKCIGMELIPK